MVPHLPGRVIRGAVHGIVPRSIGCHLPPSTPLFPRSASPHARSPDPVQSPQGAVTLDLHESLEEAGLSCLRLVLSRLATALLDGRYCGFMSSKGRENERHLFEDFRNGVALQAPWQATKQALKTRGRGQRSSARAQTDSAGHAGSEYSMSFQLRIGCLCVGLSFGP